MDRVKTLLRYEWRAYWRRFSRSGLRAGNQGIVLILSALIAMKYVQLLTIASANVQKGNSRLLSQLLGGIFLAWLFPLASNARATFASRKWLHLPLTLSERLIVRTVSLLMPPSTWLVIVGSIAICFPLAHAQNPAAGIVAGLLFIATAWLTGLTISHLLSSVIWRKLFWIAAVGLLVVAGLQLVRGGPGRALLSFQFFPATLVVRAAMGGAGATSTDWIAPWISSGSLGLLFIGVGLGALWSFKKSLATAPQGSTPRFLFSSHLLPGRLGGLVWKDFRYFRRLLDVYLGLAATVLACVYLMVAEVPSAAIFWSFIVFIFLCHTALPFNSFGLDNRAGLDRYALLPLSGEAILFSKNLAYLLIVLIEMVPLLFIAAWNLGILTSALGLVEATALAGAYLTWGNWMSVNHPLKMQFFRFANSGAALVDTMGGIMFGSLPGVVLIYLWQSQGASIVGASALIMLLAGALYFLSLRQLGKRFERSRERIAAALL